MTASTNLYQLYNPNSFYAVYHKYVPQNIGHVSKMSYKLYVLSYILKYFKPLLAYSQSILFNTYIWSVISIPIVFSYLSVHRVEIFWNLLNACTTILTKLRKADFFMIYFQCRLPIFYIVFLICLKCDIVVPKYHSK